MCIIDDVMARRHVFILEKYFYGFAPKNGFDRNIPVRVSMDEFHEICTLVPTAHITRKINGVHMKIIHHIYREDKHEWKNGYKKTRVGVVF